MLVAVALAAAFLIPAAPDGARAAGSEAAAGSDFVPGDTSNGWTVAFAGAPYPNGEGFHFYGMTFVNRDLGFAFGGQDWNAPDSDAGGTPINPGRVYRTKDGGSTWQLVHESRGWKIGMACANEKKCWVGGKRGQIYYTTDGGDTWSGANEYSWYGMYQDPPQTPQPTPVPFTAWIRSAGITTDGSAVIFGATDNTVLRSTDGVNFYNYWPVLTWNSATWSINCPTATICYGGQIKRQVLKSMNGGESWYLQARVGPESNNQNCLQDQFADAGGIQRRYYGAAFANGSYGWVVGSCGSLYRTINEAFGWQAQNANISEEVTLRRVEAYSKSNAVTVGGIHPMANDPSMTLNAIIYRTTDGATWTQAEAPDTSELHGLAGFQDATFIADWAGNIWRWDGSLVPISPTKTPTTTPNVTETPTATATPSATVPTGGQIDVVAFHDLNSNGQPDAGDPPLPNVGFQVRLNATPVATGATGADGHKLFANLDAGDYTVAITTPAVGYTAYYSQLIVGLAANSSVSLPFPHRMSTVTPATRGMWLPVLLQ
jgi:hypothetical protein